MKSLIGIIIFIFLVSCNENLLEKPDNLISEAKMVEVLKDLALVNAAKTTNTNILRENAIEPMAYVFAKHQIDSLQFVKSDRYYASLPVTYEKIYKKVESELEEQAKILQEAKKLSDSLELIENMSEHDEKVAQRKKAIDSLP